MDESRAILERLERIEELEHAGATAVELVDELRALLVEAEAWSRQEGGEEGARAVEDLRASLDSAQDRDVPVHVAVAPNP